MINAIKFQFFFIASTFTAMTEAFVLYDPKSGRRFDFQMDLNEVSSIIGQPSQPSHLPEAEPILPGHTLIRPTLGMLKSSLKFPHKELDHGAGVYGNTKNLGLNFGRNERVMYSDFRRGYSDRAEDPVKYRKSARYYDEPMVHRSSSGSDIKFMPHSSAPYSKRFADYIMIIPNSEQSGRRLLYFANPRKSALQLSDLFENDNSM